MANPQSSSADQALLSIGFRNQLGRFVTLLQVGTDFATVLISYGLSYWIYVSILSRSSPLSLGEFASLSVVAGVIYVLILDHVGLYQREISLLNIKELRGIFRASIYASALILSASFYFRSIDLSRITLTIALVLSPVLLYIQRQFFYQLHLAFHQKGWSKTRVLIYGAGEIGKQLAKRMFESPALGFFPIGFLDDDTSKHRQKVELKGFGSKNAVPVLGNDQVIGSIVDADLILIACPRANADRTRELVQACTNAEKNYAIVPSLLEDYAFSIETFEIGGIPIMRRKSLSPSFFYLTSKRIVDFTLASLLIAILSPLVLLIGLAMKIDSPGPVIFKQKRVGLRGRQFSMYKFRSMHVDSEKYAPTPNSPHDPRITRVGRWLRRTSLDELPQLFNVFRGDMSFVGPRPEMPFIVEKYTPLQRQRLEAKPGITGVWQISAFRGEPIHMNIEYDLFYLENRSLLLDFAIIVKTAWSVVRGIGAF